MTNTLLLISSNPNDQAFAASVAQTVGLTLEQTADVKQGAQAIADGRVKVVFIDGSTAQHYAAVEVAIQEAVGLFSDKVDANFIHFISSDGLDKAPYLIQSPLFGHFVVRNYGNPVETGEHYGRIIKAALGGKCFGLEKLMKPGTKIQSIQLQSSAQKQGAVEAVKNYLVAAKFQARMASLVSNAVDELLMNSMFDAPTDQLGKQLYAAVPRSTVLKLEGKQAVELQIGFDGKYAGIMSIDHFGSLDKAKLASHLSKAYTTEEYRVKTSVAGAGIGLATVFNTGGSLVFVSESGTRTEVSVFFRQTDNFRDFKDQFRFISTQFHF